MTKNLSPIVALLTLLTLAVGASATRVGLLRVESGQVTLNGRSLTAPQLLQPGQTLVLAKGARARLQLLGSNKEVLLKGPETLTVDKVALDKRATAVKRGSIASVPDIGNTTRGAANTTRAGAKLGDRGLRIQTEPILKDGQWRFPVLATPVFHKAKQDRYADWTIVQVELSGETQLPDGGTGPQFRGKELASGSYRAQSDTVQVEQSRLVPGQRYLVTVQVWSDDPNYNNPLAEYSEPFRILTADEKAMLDELKASQAAGPQDVASLLELAALYLEWDQVDLAAETFKAAKKQAGWTKLDKDTLADAKVFEQSVNQIRDIPQDNGPEATSSSK